MKNLIKLTDLSLDDLNQIFILADKIKNDECAECLKGKVFVLFFPSSSIRTRITFEMAVKHLGGEIILFPSDALDKKEAIKDVIGYMNNWVDFVIARHKDINLLFEMSRYSGLPIINAMTDVNHPCEIISDLYSISKIRDNYLSLNYTFVGIKGNIGMAWKEAEDAFGIKFQQSCPRGYEIENTNVIYDITKAVKNCDIVLTDSIPSKLLNEFNFLDYQITSSIMKHANPDALLNPCPPFYRNEEVSDDVLKTNYFVGYEFKKNLLYVQSAIILYCLEIL